MCALFCTAHVLTMQKHVLCKRASAYQTAGGQRQALTHANAMATWSRSTAAPGPCMSRPSAHTVHWLSTAVAGAKHPSQLTVVVVVALRHPWAVAAAVASPLRLAASRATGCARAAATTTLPSGTTARSAR